MALQAHPPSQVTTRRRARSLFSLPALLASFRDDRRRRANRKNRVANLEPDILHLIFDHLDTLDARRRNSHSNVLHAMFVCRAWSRHACPSLYRRIWATSLTKSESLLHVLTHSRDLSKSVRYLEIVPIWRGTDNKGLTWFSFTPPPKDPPPDLSLIWNSALLDANRFKNYLENMAKCASLCTEVRHVRLAADRHIIQEPHRAPRVDHFLDLSHTHIYLKRLHLDDGGLHASELSEIFPLTVKLPHLQELTLRNYAFISPPREQLFRGLVWAERVELPDPLPRLEILRFIHCTAEEDALAPLIRAVAPSIRSITVIQSPHKFDISPKADGSLWHSDFAGADLFAPISQKISTFTFGTRFFRSSHCFAQSNLTHLTIAADQFQRGAFAELPHTIRYLGLRVTGAGDFEWTGGDGRRGQVDIFDDIESLLRGPLQLPHLRSLSLCFVRGAQEEHNLWVKTWRIKKICKSRKVAMAMLLNARRDAWGEPLPSGGRRCGRIESPAPPPDPSKTRRGVRAPTLERVASRPKLGH